MANALVILCGGNSTRMGSDKALLPFGEDCLLTYLVKKFSPQFPKIYLSVKKKGDYSHLQLAVTEIPDIYHNAGPMSGIFSGLSMIDEESAFFMSVDTPFLEPETGIALLNALGDSDICISEEDPAFDTSAGAYSKHCTIAVGKCLLLHQFTFEKLQEKCQTRYLSRETLKKAASTPLSEQFFDLDTRDDYYKALRKMKCI